MQPRAPRPLLLALVFGVFLVIVGITATAQAVMVSAHLTASTLNTVVAADSATVRAVLNDSITLADIAPGTGARPAGLAVLDTKLSALTAPGEILRVEVRELDGTIVAASSGELAGSNVAPTGPARDATEDHANIALVDATDAAAGPGELGSPTLLREFLPISAGGHVRAIVGIWRDGVPLVARLDAIRRDVIAVTLSAGLVAALVLFLIFRAAQGRLTRQTAALLESARRDPLTGRLNHGALVAELADELERARVDGAPLGIAMVDIDNFRLVNDNHGHRAGDEALLAVVGELARQLPERVTMGRSGPDEFLVIVPGPDVVALEPAIERLRTALTDRSLQFESSERLPITVSAAICTYPADGDSVTLLLAAAARLLAEAKASGGDAVRVAGAVAEPPATTSGFDVLQGLILAVDTKDRYTKRHSEDVARYGVFLARRLGLDPELVRTIHTAGILHDVGKIGIPDGILRKPGRLTAAEYEVVKQHVALGDAIVRDVRDVDLVRAGIRHHHERWDGEGYLDRLAGEEIPLIARILAVGDAFSAMTTTRPYRKALDLREALRRLEDAAGTQLEESLVRAFVEGIETDADAPLPGAEPTTMPWVPRVA